MTAAPAALRVSAVLFDLDGTLADTAADLVNVLNLQRAARGLDALPLEFLRPVVSQGARGLLRKGFAVTPEDQDYDVMREEFLALYARNLCIQSRLFDGIPALLDALDARGVAWGVVTNKLDRYTRPLIEALGVGERARCVVSGDTCARAKPHPDPLLEAARRLRVDPSACVYLGDDERDVVAGLAAGMIPVVALYGYLGDGKPPSTWGTSHMIEHPAQLLHLLEASPLMG
jgi:2-phosphoglycolate phosphatase